MEKPVKVKVSEDYRIFLDIDWSCPYGVIKFGLTLEGNDPYLICHSGLSGIFLRKDSRRAPLAGMTESNFVSGIGVLIGERDGFSSPNLACDFVFPLGRTLNEGTLLRRLQRL